MLGGKRIPDRLYDQAELFVCHIKNKQWPEAKRCYDAVRDELCSMQADEEVMTEFFGERGERGVILKEGLFREEYVQKAYYEVAVRKEGRCRGRKDERRQKKQRISGNLCAGLRLYTEQIRLKILYRIQPGKSRKTGP